MACFGVANDEILIRSTITPYSGALPSATRSDIPPILPQLHRPSSLAIPVPGIAGWDAVILDFVRLASGDSALSAWLDKV
jgi:hypothetical protein